MLKQMKRDCRFYPISVTNYHFIKPKEKFYKSTQHNFASIKFYAVCMIPKL